MERWFPNRRSDPAGVNYPGEPVSEPIDRRNAAPGSTLPGSGGREQPAGVSPSLPLEERAGERRLVTIFDAAGRGDIPAGCRTNMSGVLAVNPKTAFQTTKYTKHTQHERVTTRTWLTHAVSTLLAPNLCCFVSFACLVVPTALSRVNDDLLSMNLKVGQCVSPARGSTGNPPTGRGRRDALPYFDASPVQGFQARIARSGSSLPVPLLQRRRGKRRQPLSGE